MSRTNQKCLCVLFLLLLSFLASEAASEEDRVSVKVNKSPSTKSKFQLASETFKTSVTKLKKSHKKVDLVFLIDSSSSVGKSNFLSEIKFVKKVLADFTVSYNHTRVGIVSFSSAGKVVRHIDQITLAKKENDKCTLINSDVPKIQFIGGGTYTYGALMEAQKIFQSSRKHSKKVIFLITDGFSNGNDPVPLALKLKEDNVTIFSVGIENGNQAELYNISSLPQREHSFLMESFPQFESLARKALHFDFRVGSYLSTSDESLCNNLCDLEANSTTCCDSNAECSCGISTGQYTCMCKPGYYGSGLINNCSPCPNGTYWSTWNLCKPCPDINHISDGSGLITGIEACKCKSGFQSVDNHKCEIIRCPSLLPPENGYFVKHPDSSEPGCENVLNAACGARCLSGFQLIGSSIRLCQANATWSGEEPSCSLKRCPSLPVPFYGMAICKNADLELFFDYSPRNYSFLTHFDNEELRVTDNMPIDTDCNFKCGHGYALVGSSSRVCLPLSKWDGLQTVCKQILCPALPSIPFVIYEPEDCQGSKSSLGTNCSISCKDGFKLKGPALKTCNGKRNGVWSNKNKHPKCIDIQAPNITCPENYNVPMEANETYAHVMELEPPEVADNSEMEVSVASVPAIGEKGTRLSKGSHTWKYFAVDQFNNEASCSFVVTVVDTTPPVWENCVDPEVVKISPDRIFVDWEEPVAYDNSNETVTINATMKPGDLLPGIYQVNYTAIDSSNNSNSCLLNITVEESKCNVLESPKNGMSVCASNTTSVWCSLNCHAGFEVYLDGLSENNQEMMTMECQHKSPSWKYDPWPDCVQTELPESVEILHIDLDIEDAFCSNNTEDQNVLMDAIKAQLCGGQENCTIVSELPSCEDILGHTGGGEGDGEDNQSTKELDGAIYHTVRRRDLGSVKEEPKKQKRMRPKGKLAIKINIYTRLSKKLGLWSQNTTRSENLKRIQYELEHLHENPTLKDKLSEMKVDLDRLKVNVNTTCQLGRVMKRNVCVKCPSGMFHHFSSNKCLPCSLGTYAEHTGQLECTKCPENFTTRRPSSRSSTECIQRCPPGSLARVKLSKNPNHPQKYIKSLMPYCKKCPPGEFQPEYDQTFCIPCPPDHHSPRGSKSLDQCQPKPQHPCDNPATCKNNGLCLRIPQNPTLFSCSCLHGFTGSYCENQLNFCLSAPCENGATCRHLPGEQLTCTCPPGFTGRFCESLLNPCDADSCENHGECSENEGESEISCECPFGFYGDRCQFKVDYCTPNPCQLGTCFSAFNSYLCQCPPGVMGRRCHLLACDYQPCPKNKICTNLPHLPANASSYACECPVGYRGANCDQVANPCDRNPCKNNGICKPVLLSRGPQFNSNLYDKFTCDCPVFMYGPRCDQLVTPDFVLEFPNSQITHLVRTEGPTKNLTQFSVCTWIETKDTQNYGTIISYATEDADNMITLTDYNGLTLYINNSHVTSDIVLNDGKFHFLCVTWKGARGRYEMFVDGSLRFEGEDLGRGEIIPANGVLVLGQEQDEVGGSFSASETFVGKLAYFDVWDRVLEIEEIHEFFSTCEPYHGNLYAWSDFKLKIEGDVRVLESPFCKECPKNISVGNGKINFINNNAIYSCHEGFYVQPMAIRHCLRTAMWQEPAPVCRAKMCPRLERPANTQMAVTKSTAGGSVTYTCDDHFTMNGKNKRICMNSGVWSGEEPICTSDINCPVLIATDRIEISYASDRGELPLNNTEFPIGTFAQIECHSGSQLKDGNSELICTEDGEWDGQIPRCEIVGQEMEQEQLRTSSQVPYKTTAKEDLLPSSSQNPSSPSFSSPPPSPPRASSSHSSRVEVTTEPSKLLLTDIPEQFWVELRNYLFHGCQTTTYQSVLCKMTSTRRFSDLSHKPLTKIEDRYAVNALTALLNDPQLNTLTIDSFFDRLFVQQNSLPEDSFRKFLCFSIDTIIWSYDNLEALAENNEVASLLMRIISPVFMNFQLKHDFENLFSSIATPMSTEMVMETTAKKDITCSISLLPQLANGFHELVDGRVIYKCKETFKMSGELLVTCGENGHWEVLKSGSCKRECGFLQLPEIMRPQNVSMLSQDVVRLNCIQGYQLHGRPNVRCLPTGAWSKILGMCSKISCNKPKSGTLISGNSYLYQDKVKVRCGDGQVYEIQCQADRSWTPNVGNC